MLSLHFCTSFPADDMPSRSGVVTIVDAECEYCKLLEIASLWWCFFWFVCLLYSPPNLLHSCNGGLSRAALLSLYVYFDVVSYLNFLFFTNRIVEIVCMLKSSVVSGHPSLKICIRRFPCIILFLYDGITASRCHCTATAFCSRQEMYQPRLHSLGEYTTIS